MRQLTSHKSDSIYIGVMDEPGPGGAHHLYDLAPMRDVPPKEGCTRSQEAVSQVLIHFQEGPIQEVGVNGVTQEALLAIVEDRLRCFQEGPFSCVENKNALHHVREALFWLHHRTEARIRRGVEGTNVK